MKTEMEVTNMTKEERVFKNELEDKSFAVCEAYPGRDFSKAFEC